MREEIHLTLTPTEAEAAITAWLVSLGWKLPNIPPGGRATGLGPVFDWEFNRSTDQREDQGFIRLRIAVERSET
jgi:hypothetical protein